MHGPRGSREPITLVCAGGGIVRSCCKDPSINHSEGFKLLIYKAVQRAADLEKGSKEVEDQSTVSGQFIAPGFVGPPASTVPDERSHAGPFRECPSPDNNVALGAGRKQMPGLFSL